jgi:aromatic ring-cleaving dioxygenase
MTEAKRVAIESWHAHVYFDAASRDAAWALREVIARDLSALIVLGRFHEQPVGPHPQWSYQLAFSHDRFASVASRRAGRVHPPQHRRRTGRPP